MIQEVVGETFNILVADDDVMDQRIAFKNLERYGVDVTVVDDGIHAVEALQNSDYDLILMDLNMPILDGIHATKVIRFHEKRSQKHVPIIAFTGDATTKDVEECLEAGMDDVIEKDASENQFTGVVFNYLFQVL